MGYHDMHGFLAAVLQDTPGVGVGISPTDILPWANTAALALFVVLFIFGFIIPVRFLTSSEARNDKLTTKNDELQKALVDANALAREMLEVLRDGYIEIRQPAANDPGKRAATRARRDYPPAGPGS